jgi:hypothetical protein
MTTIKTQTAKAADLDRILETPPSDRRLDRFWASEVSGPTQRLLGWKIFCRADGARQLAVDVKRLTVELRETRERLATARMVPSAIADLERQIPHLEIDLQDRRRLIEAAGGAISTDKHGRLVVEGGWTTAGLGVLQKAKGDAEFLLREATGKVEPYRTAWPRIPEWEKKFAPELKDEAAAAAAAKKAVAEWDALLTEVEADRAELFRLRNKRIAATG